LQEEAKEIKIEYDKKNKLKDLEKDEIKDYLEKVPAIKQRHEDLTIHIKIAEKIKERITSSLFRKTMEAEQSIFYIILRYN
jgi:hypothetical protein